MAYAVIRSEKLKSYGKMTAVGQHLSRERECPHADPERKHLNEQIIGSDNLLKDFQDRARELGYKTEHNEQGKAFRKNGVYTIEYVLTSGQEYFQGKTKEDIRGWINTNREFLEKRHGRENLINLTLHMDEQTPHLHAVVVPVDSKNKINASYYLDGARKMRELQTSYANEMKPLGLERGLEGSKANHTTVQQFYGVANRNTDKGRNVVHLDKKVTDLERVNKAVSESLENLGTRRDNAERILRDVADGKITPQQLKKIFEQQRERENKQGQHL